MDFLFNKTLTNVPDKSYISSYYIIDDDLRYVSVRYSEKYNLHYVDNTEVGEMIKDDSIEGVLDYFVITLNAPIESQISTFERVDDLDSRVVRTTTLNGNNKIIKHKHAKKRDVLIRHKTSRRKLF